MARTSACFARSGSLACGLVDGNGGKLIMYAQNGRKDFLEKKVTIRIDSARYNDLVKASNKEGFTISTIVRHLVYRYLEQQNRFAALGQQGELP